VPLTFLVVSAFMPVSVFLKKPGLAMVSVGILLLGVGWYYVFVRASLGRMFRGRDLSRVLARDGHGLDVAGD